MAPRSWSGSFRLAGGLALAAFALLNGLVCTRTMDMATDGCVTSFAPWAYAPLATGLGLAAWGAATFLRARRSGAPGAAFPWRAGVAVGCVGLLILLAASLGFGQTCTTNIAPGGVAAEPVCTSTLSGGAAAGMAMGGALALLGFSFVGWNAREHRRGQRTPQEP